MPMSNPFDLMRRVPGPTMEEFMPWLRRERAGTTRPGTGDRVLVTSGAPGVGKTTQLLSDLRVLETVYPRAVVVTSKTNFAVENANQRCTRLGASTLHKLIWNRFVKGLAEKGDIEPMESPRRYGRPEYFRRPVEAGDGELVERYVRDAKYLEPQERQEMEREFAAWDPTEAAMPAMLRDKSRLPGSCAFLWSLVQFCRWAEGAWTAGECTLPRYRGALVVDEAQDLLPIEALALGWMALYRGWQIFAYGDPQQAMDQSRELPKLWEVADAVQQFGGAPGKRRVPLAIAELAEQVLPGLALPAREWAEGSRPGRVVPAICPKSGKLTPTRGFNMAESRYAVRRCMEALGRQRLFLSPEAVPPEQRGSAIVCATPFGVKGYEHDVVTIQRWKPKHQRAYLSGCLEARRRLYVALTRAREAVVIHEEMFRMIREGSGHKWN